jgi:hypothetical protein
MARQRRVLTTRTPRELTFSVNAVSVPGKSTPPQR